ncbi:c-type cytochrome [Ramlibacter tataouinensis]|uniref:Candidate Cytochrome c n=1 Tax=Ramlibacter tataouinensis (strain ATCC BAA-407 / DSM 14655 / LMG 21543 / TTB310) TaxID=365046 RepID=F5Y599_RAMTT|nr:cytochrome c [Ramlibacter tataouinensis]AEG91409.1 Candidate Cytochrome c [Ramlibacter tataouinensis TTB310]
MKAIASLVAAAAAALLALPASAQNFQKPEDAIKYRRGAFSVLGPHFAALGAMVNGRAPFDAKAAARHGEVLAVVSTLPWTAFGPGTDKGDTKAKPEIWTEQAKFKEGADKMQAEMAKLVAATKTGNLDSIKASFGPAAGTCKACHDAYRGS